MSKLQGLDQINRPDGTLGSDALGNTYLAHDAEGWHWLAYEWGETGNYIRPATTDEVVDAMLARIRDLEQTERESQPLVDLGRAVLQAARTILPDGR